MSAEAVRAAFRRQAASCRALGSPFTAALCDMLAQTLRPHHGAVADHVLGWTGDPGSAAESLPLRLCGALHALVLTQADSALAAAYIARRADAGVVMAALAAHEATILAWLDSPPQTNEVARSAAIIGAARFLSGETSLPLRALELGASAGLNLNFGHYRLLPAAATGARPAPQAATDDSNVTLTPDWSGPLPAARFTVAETRGVDLRPLDPDRDGLRLMAYCWADQQMRLDRLRAALRVARSHPPHVDAGDAADWLHAQLALPSRQRLTLVFHTVAAQYFPPATRSSCENTLIRAGSAATSDAPIAHFSMEADDDGDGAGLRLRLWDGGAMRAWQLGRADFHGRWIRWQPRRI